MLGARFPTSHKRILEQVTEGGGLQLKHKNAATVPVKTGLEDSLVSLGNLHSTVQQPVKTPCSK